MFHHLNKFMNAAGKTFEEDMDCYTVDQDHGLFKYQKQYISIEKI